MHCNFTLENCMKHESEFGCADIYLFIMDIADDVDSGPGDVDSGACDDDPSVEDLDDVDGDVVVGEHDDNANDADSAVDADLEPTN